MKNVRAAVDGMFSIPGQYRLLGLMVGVPCSIEIWSKDVLILYLLLFIPLSIAVIVRRPALSTRMTAIDKAAAAYFLWAMLGFGIYLFQSILLDTGGMGNRAASAMATIAYAALPFTLGRLLCQTDKESESIIEGLVLGTILSCGYLIANYSTQWHIDQFTARYEIGQRIPMVVGFVAILNLSRNQSALILSAIVFLAVCLIFLSETRVAIGAFTISLVLTLMICGKNYGKTKALVVILTAILAGYLATQLSVGLRFRMAMLGATAVEYQNYKEQASSGTPLETPPRADVPAEHHLTDASLDMRIQIWGNLLGKVSDSPQHLIIGYGQLGPSYIGDQLKYVTGYAVQQYSSHNEYLDIAIRTGLVGLIIYLYILGLVLSSTWKYRNSHSGSLENAYFHMTFALLGVVVYGFFHETTRYPWFGVLFWLLAGMLSAKKATEMKMNSHSLDGSEMAGRFSTSECEARNIENENN